MHDYFSPGSSITGYDLDSLYIKVYFGTDSYVYSINTVGAEYLKEMQNRAKENNHLGRFIQNHVKKFYEPKIYDYLVSRKLEWIKLDVDDADHAPDAPGVLITVINDDCHRPLLISNQCDNLKEMALKFKNKNYDRTQINLLLNEGCKCLLYCAIETNIALRHSINNYICMSFDTQYRVTPYTICNIPLDLVGLKYGPGSYIRYF